MSSPDPAELASAGRSADLSQTADLRLAELVRQKDRKATADLVALYADAVYSFVSHRLHPHLAEAEDLTQEVFLTAFRSIHAYRGASALRQWLLGIARNKVQDYYRKRLREMPLEDSEAADVAAEQNIAEEIADEQVRKRTVRVLEDMREDYSLLLRWRYWEGKSAAEIAGLTDRSEKAVERALARARLQFRRLWEEGR